MQFGVNERVLDQNRININEEKREIEALIQTIEGCISSLSSTGDESSSAIQQLNSVKRDLSSVNTSIKDRESLLERILEVNAELKGKMGATTDEISQLLKDIKQ